MPKLPVRRNAPGYNLRELRKWWGWSPQELAKRAGLKQSLISQIEDNRADPRLSELRKLALALKANVIMLLDSHTSLMCVDEFDRKRFLGKVRKGGQDECWIWLGAKDKRDYGKIRIDDKNQAPHRVSYAMTAPLPAHWQVDHGRCKPSCVNPNHLRAVTGGQNLYNRDRQRDARELQKLCEEISITPIRKRDLSLQGS